MTKVYYKRRASVNRVIVDGKELFDVTVTITHGKAVVSQNTKGPGPGPTPQSGGGPGEEPPPKQS